MVRQLAFDIEQRIVDRVLIGLVEPDQHITNIVEMEMAIKKSKIMRTGLKMKMIAKLQAVGGLPLKMNFHGKANIQGISRKLRMFVCLLPTQSVISM